MRRDDSKTTAEVETPVVHEDFRDAIEAQKELMKLVARPYPKIVRMSGESIRADDE